MDTFDSTTSKKNKLVNCLTKYKKYLCLPKIFLSIHFGFIVSWFLNDNLTPLFFSEAFAERSLFIKFGIVLTYTPFFSIVSYIVITLLEQIYLKLIKKLQQYLNRKNILFQGKFFTGINKIYKKKWFRLFLLGVIIVGLSFSVSYYIFGENLKAQWWIIDDHEIMRFLRDNGHLDFKNIPTMLMTDTEIGDFGGKPRYRPSYYSLRLLETSLWGNHPEYFYSTRLIICSFFILVCWFILNDKIGFVGSFIFTAAVMSFNYWSDIFSRLGPSETYVVLGISLFCLGFYGYLIDKKSKHTILIWFCIFLGAIISIGSKENMVLLAIPVLWMLANSIIRKRLTISQVIASMGIMLFCAFIVFAVLSGISSWGGREMYGTDVSGSSVSTILFNEIRTFPFSIIKYYSHTILMIAVSYAFIIFGTTIITVLQKNVNRQVKNSVIKILMRCVAYLGCIYLFFLSQRLFYVQGWPTGMRYDLPGKLGEMFTLIILIDACTQLFNELNVGRSVTLFFKIGYCLLFIVIIFQNNYFFSSRESAQNNVQRTTHFTQHINQIKEETSSHPDYPVIFESFNVIDYEPILSMKYFLQANKVPNKILLNMNGYSSQSFSENTPDKSMALKLEQTSKNGGWIGFLPLVNIADLNGECFSIDFSGVSNSDCINLGRIW